VEGNGLSAVVSGLEAATEREDMRRDVR